MLTAIALIAGMDVGGSGVELFGLYGLAILVNLTATLWAAGVAMRVRSIQGGPLMQFPVFLILFLAPVYVPLEPAQRLDPRGRLGQPGHRAARGRAAASSPANPTPSRSPSRSPPSCRSSSPSGPAAACAAPKPPAKGTFGT